MKGEGYCVTVVGATGAVGQEMVSILEERAFPVQELRLLASERTAGSTMEFKGRPVRVDLLTESSFGGVEIALFSAGSAVSAQYAPLAVEAGAVVIDNTAHFRMDPEVPLVVPEINPHAIARHRGIIANPNCSTIQMVVVLKPIHDAAGIRRVVVATYQSTSGAGKEAMDELFNQTLAIFNQKELETQVFPHQIAFNCLPHIDEFLADGSTREERKMVEETHKILEDDSIRITATTVRVPVFIGHSEAVNVELHRPLSAADARELLRRAPGVAVVDDPAEAAYPLAVRAAGRDEVFVGRIREDPTVPHGLNLWIVSDNLRKGAALNAIQIAELLVRQGL